MEKNLVLLLLSLIIFNVVVVKPASSQEKVLTEQDLKLVMKFSPYSMVSTGFDTRYEGIKGTPRLYDTLSPSVVIIKGQKNRIKVQSDLDLVSNSFIFVHPRTKELMAIPASEISEVVFVKDSKELLYRSTLDRSFDKKFKEPVFYQVLKNGPVQFIKIPYKVFTQADYKGAYSVDRRYDEYRNLSRYYIMGKDSVFHQVQLNRKSLLKIFPEEKDLINKAFEEESGSDEETLVLSLLEKF